MSDTVPPWLATMRVITGTEEYAGGADNPIILGWRNEIAHRYPEMAEYCRNYTHDETPWCGLTVAYVMAHSGIRPVFGPSDTDRFLWAQAWKQFGTGVTAPQPGDVLVFPHHVTLFERQAGDRFVCRGGNQSDSVKETSFFARDCEAIRRPPAMQASIKPRQNCNIVATVFGGAADPNNSAYDEHFITDTELGVALPYRFKGARPRVRVWKDGRSVDCSIVDVGPWNINDPYWDSRARPQAETGIDTTGRVTNLAGIDLTPAAARAIGLDGKGVVDWEIIDAAARLEPEILPPLPPAPPADSRTLLIALMLSMLLKEKTMSAETNPQPMPQPAIDTTKLVEQLLQALIQKQVLAPPAPPPPPPPPAPAAGPDLKILLPMLLQALTGEKLVAPAPPPPPPPPPAPETTANPGVIKTSAWALALGAIGQALGFVGAPLGEGSTVAGTLTTLVPIVTAGLGAVGGFSPFISIGLKVLGAVSSGIAASQSQNKKT